MSFRPGGMSDSSSDESLFKNNVILPNKVTVKNSNDKRYKEFQEQNEEQDWQFRVLNACMTGHIDVIDEYINLDQDVNNFLFTGWTLLLYASSAVLPEIIEHLLELGADPNKHKDGFTPLMAVCNSTNGTTEQCLQCISVLLDAKADPDATNKDRMTPLMYACKSKGPEIVSELLKHVKNVEACDTDGRTAVFYAVGANNPEVLKILMKQKASTTVIDRRNMTVRDVAVTKNFDQITQLLNFDDEEIENFCPVSKVVQWHDALSNIKKPDPECIDEEVANILYALCLDKYRQNFKGMDLKTFLQLTEKDLIDLGMDIQYHRNQFIAGLLKFHSAKWKSSSIKIMDKSVPYTLFDGVVSLTNIARKIGVIASGFRYIKNNLIMPDGSKTTLTDTEREEYKKELVEAEKILATLKKDFQRMRNFSQKIEKDNRGEPPAGYIGPNDSKKKTNWTVILTVTLMAGMFLSKTAYIQKLWN